MILNAIVIVSVLVLALVWSTRGFFSALIHLACSLCAGAIALAFWEMLASALIGTGTGMLTDIAPGASLVGLYLGSLAALTGLTTALIRSNVKVPPMVDLIGGGVLGALCGMLTAGFFALGAGMTRTQADALGYTPVKTDSTGSMVRTESLWVPADVIVEKLYQQFSLASLSAGDSALARYYPHLSVHGHIYRSASINDVMLKYPIAPDQVELRGRYTLGEKGLLKLEELVGDKKTPKMLDNEPYPANSYVEGYVIKFKSGTREANGQVIIAPGSCQLVVEGDDGNRATLTPIAMISQAGGDSPKIDRWRFDSEGLLLGSVGGGADPSMAFEFLVPRYNNVQPVALYVKGVRMTLRDDNGVPVKAFVGYASASERDNAVKSRAILDSASGAGAAGATALTGTGVKIDVGEDRTLAPLVMTSNFPDQIQLTKDNPRELKINDAGLVSDGKATFSKNDFPERGTVRSLLITGFDPGAGTSIAMVNVTPGTKLSLVEGLSNNADGAPVLVDAAGQRFQALGYVGRNGELTEVRFTPGSPITGKDQVPSLSRSRTDQKLWLVFRVSKGVKITKYAIGDTVVATFSPAIDAN